MVLDLMASLVCLKSEGIAIDRTLSGDRSHVRYWSCFCRERSIAPGFAIDRIHWQRACFSVLLYTIDRTLLAIDRIHWQRARVSELHYAIDRTLSGDRSPKVRNMTVVFKLVRLSAEYIRYAFVIDDRSPLICDRSQSRFLATGVCDRSHPIGRSIACSRFLR